MARRHVYSDFSLSDCLKVVINGVTYECSQFSSSWAVNEVPTAVAMLAIGRNARSLAAAQAHLQEDRYQMQPASVYFWPRAEYSTVSDWPAGQQLIFSGYFNGFTYRKIAGKVHAVANFIHWLAALGFSSALTKNGHVSNPTALNAAAVLKSLGDRGAGQGVYVSSLVPSQLITGNVGKDLWASIKTVFSRLCDTDTMTTGPCGGLGAATRNDSAKAALAKMEGTVLVNNAGALTPDPVSSVPYKWGVPLALDTLGVYSADQAVAEAIGKATTSGYSTSTFWDKLVMEYCPMFGMAVVPMANSALVIADTPAITGDPFVYWKELSIDEYDSFDMSAELFKPLRGVAVVSNYASLTAAGLTERGNVFRSVGGCWAEDSVSPADGVVQYIAPPAWLVGLQYQPNYALWTTGLINNIASKVATSIFGGSKGPNPTPDTFGLNGNLLYQRYAHDFYVNSMLRGRSGSVSGKLRFDVAPGSVVKISPSAEVHLGGEDTLAFALYACVQRVTITINAEATVAGTSFMLSHVRTEAENSRPRTSVTEHPLFGKSIHGGGKHGCPLVDAFDLI